MNEKLSSLHEVDSDAEMQEGVALLVLPREEVQANESLEVLFHLPKINMIINFSLR